MIKRVLTACVVSFILATALYSEEKAITMQTMMDGTHLVQLGFLTKTEDFVKKGVSRIQRGSKVLENINHSQYISLNEIQAQVYAKEKTDKIYANSVELLKNYKAGKVFEAIDEYKTIVKQCIECHEKLRDYKDRGRVSLAELQ